MGVIRSGVGFDFVNFPLFRVWCFDVYRWTCPLFLVVVWVCRVLPVLYIFYKRRDLVLYGVGTGYFVSAEESPPRDLFCFVIEVVL